MFEILHSGLLFADRGLGVDVGEGVIVCGGVLVADWFELLFAETVEFSEIVPVSTPTFDEEQDIMNEQMSKSKAISCFPCKTKLEVRQESICNASNCLSAVFLIIISPNP